MARARKEIAKPGTQGKLHVDTTVDGERVEGVGDYRYVGQLANGMLAFIEAPTPHPIFLHPTEVVEFRPDA